MLFNPLKKEILHATWRKTLTTLAVMMIALPAHAACSNNEDGNPGQNGEIEYFTANDTLYYCDDTDWIAMRDFANSYRTVPVTFDGTTTFLNGASNLHPDTAQWTGSFWIKPTGPSENQEIFTSAGNAGNPSSGATIIRLRANDNLFFRSRSASGIIMNLSTDNFSIKRDVWNHVLFSFDLTNSSNRYVYINDENMNLNVSNYTNSTIDTTVSDFAIGSNAPSTTSGAALYEGGFADLWINFGTFIDLSVDANRRDFISATGEPVYLGEDGSLPTGSAAEVFLTGQVDTWETNKGSGNGFTKNGIFVASNDFVKANRGLTGHWKLDETSGSTAFDSSTTGADATMNGTLTGADSVTGVVGNALLLDATANTITSNDSAYDQMTNYTVCTWFFDEGNGGSYLNLVGKDSGSRTDGWNLYFEASTRALGFYNTDGRYEETAGGAYNYDEWNHVCGSTNGGTSGDSIQLYLNGTLLTQAETCLSACPDQDDSANDVTIGHKSNINIFYDDVRIYDRILIAPEIIDLFNLGKETPIGHWKLDETSGTAILDSSLNSDNGAMFGGLSGAENVNGKIETALTLDGVDDYILINDSSTLDFASGFDLTSSIWVKIPADSNCSGNKVALSYRAAFGRQWWLGCWTTNVAHFEVEASENTEINGTTPLNDGKWHLITGTYNGTTNVTSLYVDGILEATETVNLTDNLIGTSPLCIGEYGLTCTGDYHFKGALDDARIYNKELSANEVYILAHCTRPGNQFYNYNEDVHQWCDTVNSPINTTTPSSGSGGCSPEGAFRYNIDRYQSCDGAGWVDIGK